MGIFGTNGGYEMHKTKLIQILRTFNEDEFKEFGKFVASPFFSKGRNLIPLYNYLKKFYPKLVDENLSKEKVFASLYPGKKFSLQTMKTLGSSMQTLCEEYLFEVALRGNMFDYYRLLSAELSGRRLYKLSEKTISDGENFLIDEGVDVYHFRSLGELEKNKLVNYFYAKDKMGLINCTTSMGNYFVLSAVIELLQHLIRHNVINTIYNADMSGHLMKKMYDNMNIAKLIEEIKTTLPEHSEFVELYHNMVKLIINPNDDDAIEKTTRLFGSNVGKISRFGRYNLFYHIHPIINNLRSIDEDKYLNELFQIYKDMLKWQAYKQLDESVMQPGIFRSILITAVDINDMVWVKEFIGEYLSELPEEYREMMYSFGQAEILFSEKKFEKSLEHIRKINQEHFPLKYDIKTLMLMIYFELNYLEEARSVSDAFRNFLAENKFISEQVKRRHKNFIKYAIELIKLKEGFEDVQAELLLKEITNNHEVRNKKWLSEKVSNFIK